MTALKLYFFKLLTVDKKNHLASRIVDLVITNLILLNVVAIILASYPELYTKYKTEFYLFEVFSVIIFSLEYLLRLWTSPLHYAGKSVKHPYLKFIFSTWGLIDLLAILPFYAPFLFTMNLVFLRSLRLMRLLRILKLSRYSQSLRVIGQILKEKKADLGITFFMTFILLIIASTLMYNIEHQAQPENYKNIGDAFWWAIATLTTVGYGDIYPITNLGRFFSGVIAVLGIGLVALPTGIISSAFIKNLDDRKEKNNPTSNKSPVKPKNYKYCPHCGEGLHEHS